MMFRIIVLMLIGIATSFKWMYCKQISSIRFSDLLIEEELEIARHDKVKEGVSVLNLLSREPLEIEKRIDPKNNFNEYIQTAYLQQGELDKGRSSNAKQKNNVFLMSQNMIKNSLGTSNINTNIKNIDAVNPLGTIKQTNNLQPIIDPSDLQLKIMQEQQLNQPAQNEQPMTTYQPDQITPPLQQETIKEVVQPEIQVKKETPNLGCDSFTEDGIMNCENEKNQIRIEKVDEKEIEKDIKEKSVYEISLYFCLVLFILGLVVFIMSYFRQSMSKYLEKYYVKSLRIIFIDIIILITLNVIVQLLYYNRYFDVIQLEYFNIYGFTIYFTFFSLAWIVIATSYAFILQGFSNTYATYEKNWPNRKNFIEPNEKEESDIKYEERVSNIQYFILKEDFVMPISHICYTEPMVLRQDFDFAEYLGRAQAKCHLHLFNITFTTLLALISFFLILFLINLIDNLIIQFMILLTLPLITFAISWMENKRQFKIIQQLVNLITNSYEVETLKFLNLDLKKPIQFANKLKYPEYISNRTAYSKEGESKHQALFPFSSIQLPLKIIHLTLVLQIVWIMTFFFSQASNILYQWEYLIIFSFGLFVILFQIFFVIPYFLKKYSINTNIQQLKDPQIIDKVVANHKEQVMLSFQKLYRLLKHLNRVSSISKKNQLKFRPEILEQLKEVDSMKLSTIDQFTHKIGFKSLLNDELYYLDKAFTQISEENSNSGSQENNLVSFHEAEGSRMPPSGNDQQQNNDTQISVTNVQPSVLQQRMGQNLMKDGNKKKFPGKENEPSSQISQSNFNLNSILKVCSIFTQEVIMDPYKTSFQSLLEIFDQRQVITTQEFSKVIMQQYNKIEQEKLNIIIHIDDINTIINEVLYLEDKYNKISIQRISSLIRDSIEMLPR